MNANQTPLLLRLSDTSHDDEDIEDNPTQNMDNNNHTTNTTVGMDMFTLLQVLKADMENLLLDYLDLQKLREDDLNLIFDLEKQIKLLKRQRQDSYL